VERVSRRELKFATTDVGPDGNWLHDGRPFTGVAYTLAPDGSVNSEATFRHGLQWGPVWERFRSGGLYYEATFFRGVLHGRKREWRANGQWAEEGEYEYGIALWKKKWSPSGELVEDYHLRESDPAFGRLQQLRQVFAGES
jgi:antitoxin component YwqK of YwqJK toxin-antitoxin module